MLALLPLTLLSAGLILDGSVRGEVRDGATVGGQDPRAGALALELNGRTSGPDTALLFGVLPSAVLAQDNQLFARGYLELDVRIGHTGALRLRERGGYGTVDLSPVGLAAAIPPGTPLPPVQAPPARRFVSVQESNTAVELEMMATRRLRVLGSAAWNVSGGVDSEASQTLPLSRGPQAHALVEWAATRLDTLRAEGAASDTRYANGQRVTIGTLTGGWRTLLSRFTDLSLALGAGVGRASTSSAATSATSPRARTLPYAVGSADLRLTGLRSFGAGLGGAVEPVGDALTGDLVERGTVRASASWGAPGRVALNARLAGSIAVTSGNLGAQGTQAGDKFAQGELSLSLPVTRRSSLDIGARGSWLSRPLQNQPARQWIAFLGYSAQLPLLR